MLSHRKTMIEGLAATGIGAVLALSSPVPASAANEGDHWITTANCTADQKIELHLVNGAWHDEQELNPTVASPDASSS
ncbi:hypothetical protein ACFQZC_38185 [Streptacidiphilus monticola]